MQKRTNGSSKGKEWTGNKTSIFHREKNIQKLMADCASVIIAYTNK